MKKICIALLVLISFGLVSCKMSSSYAPIPMTQRQHLLKDLSRLHPRSYNIGQTYTVGQTVTVDLSSDFLFEYNSSRLTPQAYQSLQTIAGILNTFDTTDIKISAYTDNQGKPAVLKALSTQQANVIEDVLYRQYKVDTRLMVAQGFGAAHPIASNASLLGRSLNRRVVISFRFYPKYVAYD